MLHIFYGSDSYSRHQALDELKAQLDSDGMLASNTLVFDGRRATPKEVMAACDTVPFLAAHRLVIVESAFAAFNRSPGRGRRRSPSGQPPAVSEDWRALSDYIDRMPASTTLVLVDDEVSSANPLLKALQPKASVREFAPLRQDAVAGWVQRRAQAQGLSLTAGAVRLLADLVGNDLWALSTELEKLAAYASGPDGRRLDSVRGGRQVSERDVEALVTASREASIFPLVDAVVEGRPAAALKQLRRLHQQGKASAYVIAMLQRHYRLLAIAREMLDSGASGQQVGESLNLRGYGLEKLLEQAPRYPWPRLKAVYRRLLEADLSIKRGIFADELALELLVQELASARPSASGATG